MSERYGLLRYFAGAVAARAGDEMSGPALMLAAFALAGSTADASALLAGITASAALGGPVLGVLLDRAERPGRLLAGALLLHATGLGAVLMGLGRWPFAVTVLVAGVTGLLGPALSGGWTAQLPRVVPDDRLPGANALDAMTFGVAALAGPALAGGVAEALGASTAVVVSVALITLALPAAWLLPARPSPATTRPPPARSPMPPGGHDPCGKRRLPVSRPHRSSSVAGDLLAGARIVAGRPALARATLASVVCCVAQGMLMACVPLLGERVLDGAGHAAVLLSCATLSALVADAALARSPRAISPRTLLWSGALVQAAALGLASASQGRPVVLVVAFLVLGIGEGPQLAALFAVRHREAPERLRSQIFTTGASLKITGFALGAAAGGPLAGRSLSGTLALASGTAALAALVLLAVPTAVTAPAGRDARPE
ncbi:MFS transporter [Streptomyces sp. NPDC091278]|uniref:MFS transporter n=1 Tax=Streptomyces sp. NPDC091278 TaxID=3155301 RepID=UPI0034501016